MLPERGVLMGVSRVGEFDRERADVGPVERRQDAGERDVVDVRAFPVAIADMQPHALTRNALDALVDRRDLQLAGLDEVAVGKIAMHHGAVHGEVGRVDLQHEPGTMDRLVFLLHLTREGVEIGFVRIVIRVQHGRRNDAGRSRGHEHFGECVAGDRLEARDLGLDVLGVLVVDLGLRLGSILLFAHQRKAPHQRSHQLGKLLELAAASTFRDAGKSGHALRHVRLEADALLLAVVADVDAGLLLLLDHMANRLVHLGRHFGCVKGLAGFAANQQVG